MTLPKTLTTATTFSKILAMLLFIFFPLVGFRYGMLYQKGIDDTLRSVKTDTEKKVIMQPILTPSPIPSPNKAGWYRYMSKSFDFYLDYPNTYWYGGEGLASVSFEKKVDYPHRTNSWIFINDGIFTKEELDILNQMSPGEIKVIKKADDAIPSTFNTYERLPDFVFGTKKAKSFVNRSVWEGDHLYVYLYEENGRLYVFGGFTTESKDEKDYISYAELKEVLSTLRFMD